jgi:hypothetical protein
MSVFSAASLRFSTLALLAASSLAGAPGAHAGEIVPLCTNPTSIPPIVANQVVNGLSGFWPIEFGDLNGDGVINALDDKKAVVCAKIAKAAVATCHKAVAEAVSCSKALFDGVAKTARPACATTGTEESECNGSYQGTAASSDAVVDALADTADAECDGITASYIFSVCRTGNPS